MPRRKTPTVTVVELEFMKLLWEHRELGTDDLQRLLRRKGRPLSDGSIRKMLSILMNKGYLVRRKEGRGYLYRPKKSGARTRTRMVRDLVKRAFEGSPALMVASLFEGRSVSDRELQQIKKLIAARERKGGE